MYLQLLEYAGVAVFAVSGALAAGRKSLDLLGVVVIALVTATGGGTVRDVLLDRHPVFWIAEPGNIVVIIVVSLLTVPLVRLREPPAQLLLLADALGLAFFSISGAELTESRGVSGLIVVMMATITGVFGGVLRDVLCNDIPMILRKGNIYATAVIFGASVYVIAGRLGLPHLPAVILGMALIAGLRIASIVWNLSLPVFTLDQRRERKKANRK